MLNFMVGSTMAKEMAVTSRTKQAQLGDERSHVDPNMFTFFVEEYDDDGNSWPQGRTILLSVHTRTRFEPLRRWV